MIEDPKLHRPDAPAQEVHDWLPPEAPLDMPQQVLEARRDTSSRLSLARLFMFRQGRA